MPTKRTVVLGAGGHARIVIDALLLLVGPNSVNVSVVDDRSELRGKTLLGVRIVGPILQTVANGDSIVPAIGDNAVRARVVASLVARGAQLLTVVHPLASVSKFAEMAAGSFVAAHATIAPSVSIAQGAILNHGCVVDHECIVGSFAHIAPGSILGGACVVGDRCLIGAGAVILPGLHIGADCVVGAGAVVTRSIPNNTVVTGVPAKKLVSPV